MPAGFNDTSTFLKRGVNREVTVATAEKAKIHDRRRIFHQIKPASPAVSVEASDPEGVAAGIRLDFGGLRVAYGYHREWNLSSEVAATDNGDTAHQFGVKYKAGKNHFSVGYRNIQDEGQRAVAAEDELNSVLVSYRRDLGPGVQYRLNFFWADYDGEAVGSGDDNEGIALTTSVRLAF